MLTAEQKEDLGRLSIVVEYVGGYEELDGTEISLDEITVEILENMYDEDIQWLKQMDEVHGWTNTGAFQDIIAYIHRKVVTDNYAVDKDPTQPMYEMLDLPIEDLL